MIDLDPAFEIYDPPLFLFGGVQVEPPHNPDTLPKEVERVLSDIGDSLYQAYLVKSRTESNDEKLIFRAWPTSAQLDKRCRDEYVGRNSLAKNILNLARINKSESLLVKDDEGFYLLHILRKNYDPAVAGHILKTLEAVMFSLAGRRYRIESRIKGNVLNIDAELIQPKGYIF